MSNSNSCKLARMLLILSLFFFLSPLLSLLAPRPLSCLLASRHVGTVFNNFPRDASNARLEWGGGLQRNTKTTALSTPQSTARPNGHSSKEKMWQEGAKFTEASKSIMYPFNADERNRWASLVTNPRLLLASFSLESSRLFSFHLRSKWPFLSFLPKFTCATFLIRLIVSILRFAFCLDGERSRRRKRVRFRTVGPARYSFDLHLLTVIAFFEETPF